MLLLCLTALAADTVTLQVGGLSGAVEARATWLGEERRVLLRDEDGDGVQTGTLAGEELRLLPLSLWVGQQEAWRGIVPVGMGPQTLSFTALRDSPPTLQRAARPDTPQTIARREVATLTAWFGWLLLALVGLLALTRRRVGGEPGAWRWWWSLPIWAGLSVLWTWPAATAGGGAMVGRHFDILGTIWAMDAAGRMLEAGMTDPLTAWPLGRDARRFDSFTLLPIALLMESLGLDRVHGALQVVGVFLLGVFGERFARAVGARGWWGLVGGAALALSGLSANVLLEGHVYHLLNPWLPLLGLTWWRACGEQSRPLWGVLSGLLFGLCLLTTAYIGMAAAILVVGFALPALRQRQTWPAMGAAALTAAALAVPYVWLFLVGDSGNRGHGDIQSSLDLAALAPITAEGIRTGFARSLAPSAGLLTLALAGLLLSGERRRWTLLLTGGLALFFAAGMLPSWLAPPALFRFPVRLGWAALLCLGTLAALGGTALEQRCGRLSRVLVVLVFAEPLLLSWPGWSQERQMSTTPSAYRAADGPVIDLLPQDINRGDSLNVILSRLVCFYQTSHGRPIAEDCFEAPVRAGPRLDIQPWLYHRLQRGEVEAAADQLARLGFSGIALHPDLFDAQTRQMLQDRLAQIDPRPPTSTDGGEHIALYRLTPASPHTTDLSPVQGVEFDTVGDALSGRDGSPGMRFELLIPPSYKGSGFWVTLTAPGGGGEWSAELYDDGRFAQDYIDDDIWIGEMPGPLPPGGTLSIHLRGPQFSEKGWEGTLWLPDMQTPVVFMLSVSHAQIKPLLAPAPTSTSPAITPYNSRVIAAGWLVWLLAAGLIGRRIRSFS